MSGTDSDVAGVLSATSNMKTEHTYLIYFSLFYFVSVSANARCKYIHAVPRFCQCESNKEERRA